MTISGVSLAMLAWTAGFVVMPALSAKHAPKAPAPSGLRVVPIITTKEGVVAIQGAW